MRFTILLFTLVACAAALDTIPHEPYHGEVFPQKRGKDPNAYDHSYKHFDCGTNITHASDHLLVTVNTLHQNHLNILNSGAAAAVPGSGPVAAVHAARAPKLTVPLYLHVVTTQSNAKLVTPAQVAQQFRAMNAAYNPSGIAFTLKNTSWTINDAWAIGANDSDDTNMKAALRQGSYAALNIYLQSDLAGGVLGKCTLPTNVGANPPPSVYVADGCNVALGTVPNGPIQGYNMGKTAVHEAGHWLGLFHTFEGYSCSGDGDFIADTPAESESTNGCPTNPAKNTCPSQRAGADPIHNYMDYSTDACYTKFTPGQAARIMSLWKQYRLGN